MATHRVPLIGAIRLSLGIHMDLVIPHHSSGRGWQHSRNPNRQWSRKLTRTAHSQRNQDSAERTQSLAPLQPAAIYPYEDNPVNAQPVSHESNERLRRYETPRSDSTGKK